jgi:hypothetical protein
MITKEKLTKIFSSEHSFIIQNEVRRKDGEWYSRITWIHVQLPGNQIIKQCRWFGFDDIDECADDCLKYIDTLE